MFCATYFKLAALLLLEITQSDQSGFSPLIFVWTSKINSHYGKNECRATFSARQKVLNENLVIFIILYSGFTLEKGVRFFLRRLISLRLSLARTHTHTCRSHGTWVVSYTFLCVQKAFQGKMQERWALKPVLNKLAQTVTLLICIRAVPGS